MAEFKIIPFHNQLNRKDFDCASDELNHYFQKQLSQDIKRRIASCFVVVTHDNQVAGFYTLASTSIKISNLTEHERKKLPRYPTIPATLLGRLAVDNRFKGKKLGTAMIVNALQRCVDSEIASYALIVEAKDQEAINFYRHLGFLSYESAIDKLYYPLKDLSKAK